MIFLFAALIANDEGVPGAPFCYLGKRKRGVINFGLQSAPVFGYTYQPPRNRYAPLQWRNQSIIELILHEAMGEILLEKFLMEGGKTGEGFSVLCHKYGCGAMARQQARRKRKN
jgi:hypothetical protein